MVLLVLCRRHKKADYSLHPNGYYYKLISFSADKHHYYRDSLLQLSASFATQRDSVFWDSYSNTGDRFFIPVDSASSQFLVQYSSLCCAGDSVCLLVKPADFFNQQFGSAHVPFFSKNDSVIKVRFKVKRVLSVDACSALNRNRQHYEQEQIVRFFGSEERAKAALDPTGFYWVEQPGTTAGEAVEPGSAVTLSYKGSYLNGRFLERSPAGFELVYGTPDQLLKGVNYAIGRLKVGQNAKIILPSRLAFGENGSTNGLVPPYTPLLYEISINAIKK